MKILLQILLQIQDGLHGVYILIGTALSSVVTVLWMKVNKLTDLLLKCERRWSRVKRGESPQDAAEDAPDIDDAP